MRINKAITVLSTTVLLGSSVLLSAMPVFAADSDTSSAKSGPFGGLVQFFEKKFNLDHDQVLAAETEYKTQRKAERQKNMADMEKKRLDALVSSGKITSAQETAIIAELAALKTKYKLGDSSQTPAQRKTAMDSFQADLKAWATSQNIDLSFIEPGPGKMMRMGMRKWEHGMGKGSPSTTITPLPTSGQATPTQ